MSAFSGRQQGPGVRAAYRARKRAEAQERNARTPWERRRCAREGCPSGKIRYHDERTARAELVSTVIARNAGKVKRHETRVYECPLCEGWHLTSRPERKAVAS